jgi:hypothetical protein
MRDKINKNREAKNITSNSFSVTGKTEFSIVKNLRRNVPGGPGQV